MTKLGKMDPAAIMRELIKTAEENKAPEKSKKHTYLKSTPEKTVKEKKKKKNQRRATNASRKANRKKR